MLSARIEIETKVSPYKVKRDPKPTMLNDYFTSSRDWKNFCDSLDRRLRPYEEIKAMWMVLGVVFTLLFIGIIVGIVLTFVFVDENDGDKRLILCACLFGVTFLIFSAYFFLMEFYVVKRLDELAASINQFCTDLTEKWDGKVELRLERSKSCQIYWDPDFHAWISVTSTDPV